MAALRAAWESDRPAATLVHGVAGHGKTTLTLRAFEESRDAGRVPHERQAFVRCDGLSGPADLAREVSVALGLARFDAIDEAAWPALAAALDAGPVVLAVDNFETLWREEADREALRRLLRILDTPGPSALTVTVRGEAIDVLDWGGRPIAAPPLPERAREIFVSHSHGACADAPGLDALLAELGGVPLALRLVAKVALRVQNFTTLARRWREEINKNDSLRASISLSWDELEESFRPAAAALATLPEGFDEDLAAEAFGEDCRDLPDRLHAVGLATLDQGTDRYRLAPPIREDLVGRIGTGEDRFQELMLSTFKTFDTLVGSIKQDGGLSDNNYQELGIRLRGINKNHLGVIDAGLTRISQGQLPSSILPSIKHALTNQLDYKKALLSYENYLICENLKLKLKLKGLEKREKTLRNQVLFLQKKITRKSR